MKYTPENTKVALRKESGRTREKKARWRKAIIFLLLAYCS